MPAGQRRTEAQAAAFAMLVQHDYRFRSSADRYQVIKGWVFQWLPPQQ